METLFLQEYLCTKGSILNKYTYLNTHTQSFTFNLTGSLLSFCITRRKHKHARIPKHIHTQQTRFSLWCQHFHTKECISVLLSFTYTQVLKSERIFSQISPKRKPNNPQTHRFLAVAADILLHLVIKDYIMLLFKHLT